MTGEQAEQAQHFEQPHGSTAGFVDYDRMAERYQQGRSLPAQVLDRWAKTVAPYLPRGGCRVVDVGAGTGIFAAWPRWAQARVVAVEPSAAMVRGGAVDHLSVNYVRGVAELLPIRDGCADVVWVSAALQHFRDLEQAVAEFRRTLAAEGRVLVRGYVPGRSEIGWVNEFRDHPRGESGSTPSASSARSSKPLDST